MYKIEKKPTRITLVLLLLIGLFTPVISEAQESKTTTISGRLQDWIEGVSDTPEVIVFEKFQTKDDWMNRKVYKASMERDSFYVSIESTTPLVYVKFVNFFEPVENLLRNSMYLIERGGDVRLHRNKQKKVYVESENNMLKCQIELLSGLAILENLEQFNSNNGEQHEYLFREMKEQRRKVTEVLSAYSSYLTPFQYELIRQNYVSYIDLTTWDYLGILAKISKINPDDFTNFATRMITVHDEMRTTPRDSIINSSNTFLDAEMKYNWALGYMFTGTQGTPDLWFDKMFQRIKSDYNGVLRDKLLFLALKDYNIYLSNQKLIEYIEESLALNEDGSSKDNLLDLFETVKPGNRVQYFGFNKRDGTKVSLDDFKGQVVLAHFWSLGCTPCIEMTKNIAPLFEKYANDKDIAFLNINVNSSLKHWEKGLELGIYSHQEEMLLNVGEVGMLHPLLKYYNYYGIPQLMIIDKTGNLVSSNAPRARNKIEFEELESMLLKYR